MRIDGLNLKVVGPVDHIKPPPTVSFEKQGLKFSVFSKTRKSSAMNPFVKRWNCNEIEVDKG